MAQIKALLIAHAEKAVLIVAALFALYSISTNLLSDSSEVDGQVIRPTEIDGKIRTMQSHVNSGEAQKETGKVQPVRRVVEAIRNAKPSHQWQVKGMDAVTYVIPPAPLEVKNIVPVDGELPEADYWPNLAGPVDVRVRVGGKRIVIAWRADDSCNYLRNLQAVLWRKAVGEAKTGTKAQVLAAGKEEEDQAEEPARSSGLGMLGESDSRPERKEPLSQEAEEKAALIGLQEEINREERRLKEVESRLDVRVKRVMAMPYATNWTLLKGGILPVEDEPDLEAILSGEEKPEPISAEDNAAESTARWFVYVDNAVEENTVYRYRIALAAQAMDLPEEMRGEKKYKWFAPFVRLRERRLALLKNEFKDQLKKLDRKEKGAKARQVTFRALVEKDDGQRGETKGLRYHYLPGDAPTVAQRKTLLTETMMSSMAWSGYAVTPVRTEIRFTSTLGEGTAMFMVLVVDDQGNRHKERFTVNIPQFDRPVLSKPILNPQRYYGLAGFPKKIKPVSIGGMKQIRSKSGEMVDFDFRTNWGLVDIRKCDVEVKRYSLVKKKNAKGETITDADGNPVKVRKYKSPITLPTDYCVLMELKPKQGAKPRMKPLPRYRDPKGKEFRYTFKPFGSKE